MKENVSNLLIFLKRKLGKLKYILFDVLPYRTAEKKASKTKKTLEPQIFSLPQLESEGEWTQTEVHMLCGQKHLSQGIAASWSLMRFFPGASLVIHSDGSLNDELCSRWKEIIPNFQLLEKKKADREIARFFTDLTPIGYQWRSKNWAAYQTMDYHLFAKAPYIISMDSDVIVFSDPLDIKEFIREKKEGFLWNEDTRSCYPCTEEELSEITGLKIPPQFNAGFTISHRLQEKDWLVLEDRLEKLESAGVDINHHWSAQTYLAIMAAPYEDSLPLPETYSVKRGRTEDSQIARHFVGIPSIRPRLFTEGWKTLLNQAQAAK
jgi:hypothetical protein